MRKIIIILLMMLLVGCSPTDEINKSQYKESDNFYFVELNRFDVYDRGINMTYKIVYAKDTKVKYLFAMGYYRYAITPLYNNDGTLQLYEE